MSDKINSLNLCVCMALADHGLGKDETSEILKIANLRRTGTRERTHAHKSSNTIDA